MNRPTAAQLNVLRSLLVDFTTLATKVEQSNDRIRNLLAK
jgi:hypothetical protein